MQLFFFADVLLWHTVLQVALGALIFVGALYLMVGQFRRAASWWSAPLRSLGSGAAVYFASWLAWGFIEEILIWPAYFLAVHVPLITG